jgi:UDP-N-acetylmuramoylalanine--D-glutamate ligase
MLDLAHKRVLVLGLGISGRSAAAFCAARGARVVAADERAGDLAGADALPADVTVQAGAAFPDPAGFDLVVPSPGVPPERYRARARRAWGDIELCFRALSVPIVAVTGTNGKSTTVHLVAAMLRAAGLRARVGGNVGVPALDLVGAPIDVAVLEVSSFQLEAVDAFRPRVAVVLNVTPDHLDRHGSFEAYAAAKARLLARQEASDTAVLNLDDPVARGMANGSRAAVRGFTRKGPLERGAWLDAGAVALRTGRAPAVRLALDGVSASLHRENLMAALCAAVAAGAEPARAWAALAGFESLPHRCQLAARRGGVDFVDDSKATNPEAALASLRGIGRKVVWIAGGRAKGLDLRKLADAACAHARAAVVLGEAAPVLERALDGRIPVRRADTIEEATRLAADLAVDGDAVLLAPGCSSLDQFRSFEERGDRFQAAARALSGAEAPA